MATSFVSPAGAGDLVAGVDLLRLAVAAYLARFKGMSRSHTESDLRCFLIWCTDRELDPLAARRAHIELYVRWMQEIRHFQPSTVSRRLSVVCGFYRICVLDTVLALSPTEHVRRPPLPTESPTLGLGHLQFEAILSAARQSPNRYDFALVAMLGLLGLRIFEATGANNHRPGRGTRPPRPARARQGRQDRARPATTGGRPRPRPGHRPAERWADPAQPSQRAHGPPRR